MFRTIAVTLLVAGLSTSAARAAEGDGSPAITTTITAMPGKPASRPASLPLLYASFAGLQAFDVYSTRAALSNGATEANPLMQGIATNTAGLTVAKVVGTASVIYMSEHLWRTNHRKSAVITMIVGNGLMSMVAIHNAGVLSRQH